MGSIRSLREYLPEQPFSHSSATGSHHRAFLADVLCLGMLYYCWENTCIPTKNCTSSFRSARLSGQSRVGFHQKVERSPPGISSVQLVPMHHTQECLSHTSAKTICRRQDRQVTQITYSFRVFQNFHSIYLICFSKC